MPSLLREIPEVAGLDGGSSLVRIPQELDVPLTPRVRAILDTTEFRRLAQISQLGLVALVYPAANHTRFEHSLGVYRLALLFLRRLSYDARFDAALSPTDAELFLAAALLHDLGHWPFCHPLEDIKLPDVPRHELFAQRFLLDGEIADVLCSQWSIDPNDIVRLLTEKPQEPAHRILASMLSGPIDIDKMDYLARDSLHAGVPYGRHFDQARLIASLCLNEQGDGLAITEKGKTAAEMMLFARYVMFSEVYWHHAVRSATAMLQRAFYLLHESLDFDALFKLSEHPFIAAMTDAAAGTPAEPLVDGLFGPKRNLYRRVAQYSDFENRAVYQRLAQRPYPWLVACGRNFAEQVSTALGKPVAPDAILFDAPPVSREVEFNLDVYYAKEKRYRPLGDVSPVVRTLAQRQFDDYVKRVRIFAHRDVADDVIRLAESGELLTAAIDQTP